MNTLKESGHVKNLAAAESLVTHCNGFGSDYSPTNENYSLENLRALIAAGRRTLLDLNTAKTNFETAINNRKRVFSNMGPSASKALGALMVAGVQKETIDDARGYYNKLVGRRSSSSKSKARNNGNATNPDGTPVVQRKTISASQTSYDWQVEHFAQFISTLKGSEKYRPNETDVKIATLSAIHADAAAQNSAVIVAEAVLSSARIARDNVFDKPEVGLVDVCRKIKVYVRTLYGQNSKQYKKLTTLKFTRQSS